MYTSPLNYFGEMYIFLEKPIDILGKWVYNMSNNRFRRNTVMANNAAYTICIMRMLGSRAYSMAGVPSCTLLTMK